MTLYSAGLDLQRTTKAAMMDDFTELIRALPERAMYTRSELITPQFKLAQEKRLAMYYAPFDSINPAAKLALIGVTPGWTQMEISYRIARRELLAGRSLQEAHKEAKRQASFGGSMRSILVSMLDDLGVAKLLRLTSSHELFGSAGKQLHTTSAIRYPVFVDERNYTGSAPVIMTSPLLMDYARRVLAPSCRNFLRPCLCLWAEPWNRCWRFLSRNNAFPPAAYSTVFPIRPAQMAIE